MSTPDLESLTLPVHHDNASYNASSPNRIPSTSIDKRNSAQKRAAFSRFWSPRASSPKMWNLKKCASCCLFTCMVFWGLQGVFTLLYTNHAFDSGDSAARDDPTLDAAEAPAGFEDKFAVYVINMEAEPDKLGTFYLEAEKRLFPHAPAPTEKNDISGKMRGGQPGDPHPLVPQSMPIKRWSGVYADQSSYDWAKKQGLYGKNTTGMLWGNIGASMAHLSLWKHAYDNEKDKDYVLVFEDDEKINEGFWDRLSGVIEHAENGYWKDFDMVNLNVLRPWGTPVTENMLRVNHTMEWRGSIINQVPNVWLSAYLLKRENIPNLLRALVADGYSGNYALSRQISDMLRKMPHLHAYVLRTNYISTHVETKSLRRAQNGYFCSHFINC